jgi:hypothetical protein
MPVGICGTEGALLLGKRGAGWEGARNAGSSVPPSAGSGVVRSWNIFILCAAPTVPFPRIGTCAGGGRALSSCVRARREGWQLDVRTGGGTQEVCSHSLTLTHRVTLGTCTPCLLVLIFRRKLHFLVAVRLLKSKGDAGRGKDSVSVRTHSQRKPTSVPFYSSFKAFLF